MIEVKLKKGEPVERALKKLRRKMERENVLVDAREHQYYEKPARKRYKHKKRAKYIQRLKSKEERDWG